MSRTGVTLAQPKGEYYISCDSVRVSRMNDDIRFCMTMKHSVARLHQPLCASSRMVLLSVRLNLKLNKKAQLSLTNPRDACETFARFT